MARTCQGGWSRGEEAKSARPSCERIAAICVLFEEMIRVYFIARKGCQAL